MADSFKRLRTLEPDSSNALYQTLLESTLAIPFKIDWASKKYTYVGPQIESLLGWSVESWQTVDDWAARIHADERDETVNRCVELCLASVDHEAEYRALTKDNGFVWVREVVHVLCDEQGQPTALVGFTFDISEHKKVEQFRAELEERNVRLQQRLSLTQDLHDGLGGVLVHMIASVEQGRGTLTKRRCCPCSSSSAMICARPLIATPPLRCVFPLLRRSGWLHCAAGSTICLMHSISPAPGSLRKSVENTRITGAGNAAMGALVQP